jgi:hypothetical protein
MANTLSTLVVRMAADIGQFQSDMGKAVHEAQKFKTAVNRILGTVGVGVSIGAFASFIKGSIDAADALNDLRTRTGLTGQQLLVLKGAADRSGSSLEGISDVTSKLSSRLTEAARGTGDAAEAYAAMGINVKDVNGNLKNVDTILKEVGAKFQTYEDGANKAALATAAFGRGGDKLIPVVEAIEETEQRFKRLGITIEDEVITAADKFNDKARDIRDLVDVMGRRITAALLPAMNTLADALTNAAQSGDFFNTVGAATKTVLETLLVLGANVAFVFRSIGIGIGGAIAQMEALARGDFKGFKAIRKELESDLNKLRSDLDSFEKGVFSGGSGVGISEPAKRRIAAPGLPDLKSQKAGEDAFRKLLDQRAKLELDLLKDLADKRQSLLDAAYQDNLISERNYWHDKVAIQKEALDAELRVLNDQIQRQEKIVSDAAKKGRNTKDYYEAVGNLEQSLDKRNKLERDFSQFVSLSYLQAQRAADSYRKSVEDLNTQILELQGRTVEAAQARFTSQTDDLRKKFTINNDQAALAQLATLERLTIAQAEFNSQREKQGEIQARLSIEEERIQNSLRVGAISELEALQRTGEARAKSVSQLESIVQKLEEVAKASQNPALILQAEQARASLEKLRSETDLLAQKFDTIFTESFSNAFADFIDGTKSAKDAFRSFADDVVKQINKMVAESLSKQLFNAVGLGPSGRGAGVLGQFGASLFGSSKSGVYGPTPSGGNIDSGGIWGAISNFFGGSYATGTDYVPHDMLAFIHKGEAVIPASENTGRNTINISVQGNVDRRTALQIGAEVEMALARSGRNL